MKCTAQPETCRAVSAVRSSDDELAPDELRRFQTELWRLLGRRTALYTMGESSSVPELVAHRLLGSVLYTVGIDADEIDPAAVRSLLEEGLDQAFERGLNALEDKVRISGELWERACLTTPLLESVALRDTLESLRNFRAQYDWRNFAHEIPSDIDYLLSCPVPETLRGVDYVNEYLRRLIAENEFMQRFDLDACSRVLHAVSPEYRELLINLFEPIAANAIGCVLGAQASGRSPLRADVRSLIVAPDDREALVRLIETSSKSPMNALLDEAAQAACRVLGIQGEDVVGLVRRVAHELYPRLSSASLAGVFVG